MFKVGQKVVCKNVEAINYGLPNGIKKDKTYTIVGIDNCACGRTVLDLAEAPTMQKYCGHTNIHMGFNAKYYAFRFEPLKYDTASNMEVILEILEKKVDITIEEEK